jgi:hypothetical protein
MVLEANINATAKRRRRGAIGRQFEVNLEQALEGFGPPRISRVDGHRAAARPAQRLAWKILASSWHFANDAHRQSLL